MRGRLLTTALLRSGGWVMGWRAWDAYEREARARVRALPWHQHYSHTGAIIFALIVAFILLVLFNVVHAQSAKLTNEQIIERVIQASQNTYYATGHPCARSYEHDRCGHACGGPQCL
jgi:TRAP-type C4-dicarboxylate transport system permease small subunit